MSNITIYDVARESGFSVGTVNRALSGKNRIKPETRERILQTASRLGYTANAAAQALRRTPIRIGAVLFCPVAEYADDIEKGIRFAAEDLEKYHVSVEIHRIVDTDSKSCCSQTLKFLRLFSEENIHGVILFLSAGHDELREISAYINQMAENGIPVVTVANDMPESRRVFYVGINAFMAGRMAAEFLSLCCPGRQVAVMSCGEQSEVNSRYLYGFHEFADRGVFSDVKTYSHYDRPELVLRETDRMLDENPSLAGVYMTTASSAIACRRIRERGKKGLRILTTDLLRETPDLLRSGTAGAVIFQDPFRQGREAMKAIYSRLTAGLSEGSRLLTPILLFSSNIGDYLSR